MPRFQYENINNSRDSSSESQLELMSAAKAEKIARLSKEISSNGPVQQQTYSKNLDIISPALVSGDANIMIVGDSINNPGVAGFMRIGYKLQWSPNYWKGIAQALGVGNSIANGTLIQGGYGSNVTGYSLPGPEPLSDVTRGTPYEGIQVAPQGSQTAKNVQSGDNSGAEAAAYEAYRLNAVASSFAGFMGTSQTTSIVNNTQTTARLLIYAAQDTSISIRWRLGNGGGWNAVTTPFPYELSAGYNVVEREFPNAGTLADAGGATKIFMTGNDLDSIQLIAATYLDKGVTNGMQMAYVGGGGWKTEHHQHSNESTALVGSVAYNQRRIWYTDDAIKEYINFMGSNIIMIHTGANDGDSSAYTDHIEAVINRYRGLKSGLKFLIINQYDLTNDSRGEERGHFLNSLAGSEGFEDVAFIDLRKRMFDVNGLWSTWQSTYLGDGIHPNQAGSELFASYEWDAIVASNAAVGSDSITFPAVVYGNEQYQQLMTSFKRVK